MRNPVNKKSLLAAAALTGAVVYWRVRQNRIAQDREWEEEIQAATDEGFAAAHAALASQESGN